MQHDDILQVEGINSKGFGTIPKLVMQDERLSISAKAIYAYFCSYAGAGKQAFPRVSRIIKDLGISKNAYYKHFNQLRDCGYIKTEQAHKGGRLSHNIYTLTTEIQCTKIRDTVQCTKIQDTVKQDTVFCDTRKKNSLENKQYFKSNSPPLIPHGGTMGGETTDSSMTSAESFKLFWQVYPKKKAYTTAKNAWRKLDPSPELVRQILAAVEKQKLSKQWKKENGQYIPEPTNWLKKERWLDNFSGESGSLATSYEALEVEKMLKSGIF